MKNQERGYSPSCKSSAVSDLVRILCKDEGQIGSLSRLV